MPKKYCQPYITEFLSSSSDSDSALRKGQSKCLSSKQCQAAADGPGLGASRNPSLWMGFSPLRHEHGSGLPDFRHLPGFAPGALLPATSKKLTLSPSNSPAPNESSSLSSGNNLQPDQAYCQKLRSMKRLFVGSLQIDVKYDSRHILGVVCRLWQQSRTL